MKSKPSFLQGAAFALFLIHGACAHASVWTETGDAVDMPAGQYVGAGIDRINGSIQPLNDVDMYRLQLGSGLFTASTVGLSSVDTQLYLFDANGFGIVGNDDASSASLQSTISANLTAGVYFLAISAFNSDPLSLAGRIFPDSTDFTGDPNWSATGPGGGSALTGWTSSGGATTTQAGSYGIQLNTATVPEPASMGLAGLALTGVLWSSTRRKKNTTIHRPSTTV
ncbi:DVUA0089 family protein [Aquabacterium lacunae]|uniref:DVUA0089 family protein n=1 Tax=Aquabacterium lacunae TaxID=2528630 RepID=UPI0013EF4B2D|nr:DVUA0089 family protein [Aquabacterium lacunae]